MPEYSLILRTCREDMTSYNGFLWPDSGPVTAPDWVHDRKCGHGLHGFLWGEGKGSLADFSDTAKWLVVRVLTESLIDLKGKVKYPAGEVVSIPKDRQSATSYIHENGGMNRKIIGIILTGGDNATLTGGNSATLTGGDCAALTGGDNATLTGGHYATMTGGDNATLTGGHYATMTGGDNATLTGGRYATMTGGDSATLTGGDRATLTGGDNATLFAYWYEKITGRYRIAIAYIGEDGMLPNTPYKCVEGKFEVCL